MERSFWRAEEIDFSVSNSSSMSGGLIILWKDRDIEVLCSYRSEGYLGIKIKWKDNLYYIVNISFARIMLLKQILWKDMYKLKGVFGGGEWEWVIGGYFNAVKNKEEIHGRAAINDKVEWR